MQARQLLLPSSSLHWCHCNANSLPSLPRFRRLFPLWIGLRAIGGGGRAGGEGACLSVAAHFPFPWLQNEGFEVKCWKSSSYCEGVRTSHKENESEQDCQSRGLAKNHDMKLK